MSRLAREVVFAPAFDRRSSEPGKNYGIHGVELQMYLIGDEGAVQFVLYTNWQLPHVQQEHQLLFSDDRHHLMCRPLPSDLGFHSKVPLYPNQSLMDPDCRFTGGLCYYDGSSLQADEIYKILLAEGSDGVWRALEHYYERIFHPVDEPDQ